MILGDFFFLLNFCFAGVPYSKYSKFDDLMDGMHGPLFKNELAEFTASMPDVQKKLGMLI